MNGVISEIKALNHHQLQFAFAAFLGTVGSGFLMIFQFRPDLVEKFDIIRIIILSLCLTLPLFFMNAVTVVFNCASEDTEEPSSKRQHTATGAALLLTAIFVYPVLFLAYLFDWRFTTFIWTEIGLHAFYVVFSAIVFIRGLRRKKTAKVS